MIHIISTVSKCNTSGCLRRKGGPRLAPAQSPHARLSSACASEDCGKEQGGESDDGGAAPDVFAGGCFFAAAAHEFDARPGPVRDALRNGLRRGLQVAAEQLRLAVRLGELVPDTDIDQLVFELHGAILESKLTRQLLGDPKARDRARRAIRDRLARAANTRRPTANAPEIRVSR
ncbi:TetR family transcriptional regulator C-terminal domain-containing protein [Streptomyces sp. NPDC057474]|uniref:TetR family transcriptional regulator C-terminal domain-containing protein n=1 Tax=Streptomyces sp. NPDC057474 TaxID=3346144 RepID=UPI0036B177CD